MKKLLLKLAGIVIAAVVLIPIVASAAPFIVPQGGTGIGIYTPGDILYATGANTLVKLPIGGNGTCLGVNNNLPAYIACATASVADPNFVYYNGSGIHLATSTNQLLLGSTASSSSANLEINAQGGMQPLYIGSSTDLYSIDSNGGQTIQGNIYRAIAQTSHGFTVGQWVGLTSSGTYALANSIPGGVYQGIGIVSSVPDSNHFILQVGGDFNDTNMIPGMTYYLSASSTQALGTDVGYPPSSVGFISAPVAVAKSSTLATIQIQRPSIVAQSTGSFGMNVGNDMIGNTYLSTSTMIAQAQVIVKNLASPRIRVALPSYNNAIGIYNARQLALYYQSLGFYVSYGVTGVSGTNNATTYAAWVADVPTEAAWASANGIPMFYIGNEEDNVAKIGQFGTVTEAQIQAEVLTLSTAVKSSYPTMRIAYATAQGTVIDWHNLAYPDFGALDSLGFNMYDTQSAFPGNIAFFQSEIGSKYFVSEWAANYPYYDEIHSHGETATSYAADLASRATVLSQYGEEAYFFAFGYGDNSLSTGNWNIYLSNGTFNPGAISAFGGSAGNAILNTPLILTDNQVMYVNSAHTSSIESDITNLNITAPEFGNFKINGRTVITSSQTPQLKVTNGTQALQVTSASSGTETIQATGGTPVINLNNNVGIASSTPAGALGVNGAIFFTATSTGMNGINLTAGCYAFQGTCIAGGGGGAQTPWSSDINGSAHNLTNVNSIAVSNIATSTIGNLSGVGLDVSTFSGANIGAKANAAYAVAGTANQTGIILLFPQGKFSFSTEIKCGNNGITCLLKGSPVGTELDWTGTATSTQIDSGQQNSGVTHVSGGGIEDIRFVGNNTSKTGVHQVGIEIGGTNGTDGTILNGLTIEGFGQGVVTGAHVYHLLTENSTIRNNGQNWYSAPANDSGESIDFLNVFMIDNASNNPVGCFYMDDFSAADMIYTGGSIDDCQVYLGEQNNSTFNGVNWENPSSAYGQYAYVIGGDSHYTVTNINGGMVFNDQGSAPSVWFNMAGGNINFTGVTLMKAGGAVTDLAATTGGNVTWSGLNNSSGAVTNIVGSNGFSINGTNGTYQISALATPAGSVIAVDPKGNIIATTSPSITGANLSGVITSVGAVTSLPSNGITSSNLSGWLSDETGTGAVVLNTSPNLTTPIIGTNARIPLVIGGTTASASLTLQSTSGVGTTDSILFQTASQQTRGIVTSGGLWGFGTTTPSQTVDVNGSINVEGAANGIIMHDDTNGLCYILTIHNGTPTATAHACK